MKTILPANRAVLSLLGREKPQTGVFRRSQYIVEVPCEDGRLLFHTMTAELVHIPAGETADQNRVELIRRRFLVPDEFDEYAQAQQLRALLRLTQKQNTVIDHFLVFTTTDCNARCYYCYELGRPHCHMSPQTAEEAADYILRVSGSHAVSIRWFGGEPLYNRPAIDRITARLRRAGKEYRSKMTSNGYLFDAQTVRTAMNDWKLHEIQIALDGTEQVYNRAKAYIYRDDPSPYRRVMRNIGLLLDAGVKVEIRLNLGVGNFEDLMALARELQNRFADRKNLFVYVALLHDFGTAPQSSVDDDERLRRWKRLTDTLKASGLQPARGLDGKLSLNYCMADRDDYITVMPDGSLGKCEHECNQEFVGNIHDGVLDKAAVAAWKEHVEISFCQKCELFPRCQRLKRCAWINGDCGLLDRGVQREKLKAEILVSYENSKTNVLEMKAESADFTASKKEVET